MRLSVSRPVTPGMFRSRRTQVDLLPVPHVLQAQQLIAIDGTEQVNGLFCSRAFFSRRTSVWSSSATMIENDRPPGAVATRYFHAVD